MRSLIFLIVWVFLNFIGFVSGSYLGATSVGLIPELIPGMAGILLGDLVFGLIIGLFQWLALRLYYRPFFISYWWIFVTSLGFTFGARAGSLLTYQIANDSLSPSVVFGIFMGGSMGVATAFVMRGMVTDFQLLLWIAISSLGWVMGEQIAFSTDFVLKSVPYVSLAVSFIKGLGLIWLGMLGIKNKT